MPFRSEVRTSTVKAALQRLPPKRRKPGAGRKPSGRVKVCMMMLPAAYSDLATVALREGVSMGRAVEALLAQRPEHAGQATAPLPLQVGQYVRASV